MMVFGIILILFSALAWIGQLVSLVAPALAGRLGLTEIQEEVDPVFWGDVRAEALWDTLVLWTLLMAGILLTAGIDWWTPFALFGGGMYVYFGGRGILQRLELRRRGVSVGADAGVHIAMVMLGIWGGLGAASAVLATLEIVGVV